MVHFILCSSYHTQKFSVLCDTSQLPPALSMIHYLHLDIDIMNFHPSKKSSKEILIANIGKCVNKSALIRVEVTLILLLITLNDLVDWCVCLQNYFLNFRMLYIKFIRFPMPLAHILTLVFVCWRGKIKMVPNMRKNHWKLCRISVHGKESSKYI